MFKDAERIFSPTVTSIGQDTQAQVWAFMNPEYFKRYHHAWYAQNYPVHYAGASRVTYVDLERDRVYKVPMNRAGEIANQREAMEYEMGCPNVPMAPCELENGILKMVKVTPLDPEWVAEHLDFPWMSEVESLQVGEFGEDIVVYDYGTWGEDDCWEAA